MLDDDSVPSDGAMTIKASEFKAKCLKLMDEAIDVEWDAETGKGWDFD